MVFQTSPFRRIQKRIGTKRDLSLTFLRFPHRKHLFPGKEPYVSRGGNVRLQPEKHKKHFSMRYNSTRRFPEYDFRPNKIEPNRTKLYIPPSPEILQTAAWMRWRNANGFNNNSYALSYKLILLISYSSVLPFVDFLARVLSNFYFKPFILTEFWLFPNL